MLGSLLVALAVAAGPEPASVGSVEGPFAWVDLHGTFQRRLVQYDPDFTFLDTQSSGGSRDTAAAQLQLFAGWGVPLLGTHLAITAAARATLLPGPFEVGGTTAGVVSPVQLGASLPLALGPVALVPRLALGIPVEGYRPRPLFSLRPELAARWRPVEALLAGVRAGVELPLGVPTDLNEQLALRIPRGCLLDGAGCDATQVLRPWAASLGVQLEWAVLPALSLTARLDVALDAATLLVLLGSAPAPDAAAGVASWRTWQVRPGLEAHWAFAEHWGLTAGLAVEVTRHHDVTLVAEPRFTYAGWQGHLSLWFRTDPGLLRAWLER